MDKRQQIVIIISTFVIGMIAINLLFKYDNQRNPSPYTPLPSPAQYVTTYHGTVASGEFFPTVGAYCKDLYQIVAREAAKITNNDAPVSLDTGGVKLSSVRVVVTKSHVNSECTYESLPEMKPVNYDLVEVTVHDGHSEADGEHGYVGDAHLRTQ